MREGAGCAGAQVVHSLRGGPGAGRSQCWLRFILSTWFQWNVSSCPGARSSCPTVLLGPLHCTLASVGLPEQGAPGGPGPLQSASGLSAKTKAYAEQASSLVKQDVVTCLQNAQDITAFCPGLCSRPFSRSLPDDCGKGDGMPPSPFHAWVCKCAQGFPPLLSGLRGASHPPLLGPDSTGLSRVLNLFSHWLPAGSTTWSTEPGGRGPWRARWPIQ